MTMAALVIVVEFFTGYLQFLQTGLDANICTL